eukprot:11104868-Prorocentrum_lima.AAC.1
MDPSLSHLKTAPRGRPEGGRPAGAGHHRQPQVMSPTTARGEAPRDTGDDGVIMLDTGTLTTS